MKRENEVLVELLSAASHDGWMDGKRAAGITTRRAEDGEELMVPYGELSEKAKDLDRFNVRSVLAAIERAGFVLLEAGAVKSAIARMTETIDKIDIETAEVSEHAYRRGVRAGWYEAAVSAGMELDEVE